MRTIIIPSGQTVNSHEFFDVHNVVQCWKLEPNSKLIFVHEQVLPSDTQGQFKLHFELGQGSYLYYWPLLTGGSHCNLSISIILDSYAQAFVNGGYALNQDQDYSIKTHQEHRGTNASSNLVINGIVADGAMVNYEGMITVHEQATKTNANQENKTILCGTKSRAVSIPSLEIKTNDVFCGHGSAIGPLVPDHIRYLQSRGISFENAKLLLLQSFFNQTLETLPKPFILQDIVMKFVCKALSKEK